MNETPIKFKYQNYIVLSMTYIDLIQLKKLWISKKKISKMNFR